MVSILKISLAQSVNLQVQFRHHWQKQLWQGGQGHICVLEECGIGMADI